MRSIPKHNCMMVKGIEMNVTKILMSNLILDILGKRNLDPIRASNSSALKLGPVDCVINY